MRAANLWTIISGWILVRALGLILVFLVSESVLDLHKIALLGWDQHINGILRPLL